MIAFFFILSVTSAYVKSPTIDEPNHFTRGYAYFHAPDLRLNTHHPPIANALSYLPAAGALHYSINFSSNQWNNAYLSEIAKPFEELLYKNKIVLLTSRLTTIFIGVLLGYCIFIFTNRYFGKKTALIALALYSFSPSVLAHTRLITTDIPATFSIFLTLWFFIEFLQNQNIKKFFLFCVSFCLALLIKYSAMLLFPVYLITYLVYEVLIRKEKKIRKVLYTTLKYSAFFVFIFFLLLSLVFRFESPTFRQTFHSPDKWDEFTLFLTNNAPSFSVAPILSVSEKISLPGMYYWNGLFDNVINHNIKGHPTYLLGSNSTHGSWLFFPMSILFKTTPAILAGLIISFYFFTNSLINKNIRKEKFTEKNTIIFLTFFIFILFFFCVALNSRIQIGIRHLLPIFPPVFIFIAYSLKSIFLDKKWGNTIGSIFVSTHIASSLLIYPHFIEYFNLLSGGPKNGYRIFLDSNLDWGQNKYYVEKYAEKIKNSYPNTKVFYKDMQKCIFSPGFYIISANELYGLADKNQFRYAWLKDNFSPIDRIHNTHFVYSVPKTTQLDKRYKFLCRKN